MDQRHGPTLGAPCRTAIRRPPQAQCGSFAPASATATPAAPARTSVGTTPRRSASRTTTAPASTPYCHVSDSARASGTATPRMAPIAAGPAPREERRRVSVLAQTPEPLRADEDEQERRRERDERGEQAAADAGGRIADGGDRLHHRPGRHLPERDRVEELTARQPVVVRDGVRLHERDDHEAAAVRERADLERDPHERSDADEPVARVAERELERAAGDEHEHEPRADRRRGDGRPQRGRRASAGGSALAGGCRAGGSGRPARRPPRPRRPRPRRRLAPTAAASRRGRARRARG